MKRLDDRKCSESREHATGNMVWLKGINIRTDLRMQKLDEKLFIPFKVLMNVGP